jgi:hypothetical protein
MEVSAAGEVEDVDVVGEAVAEEEAVIEEEDLVEGEGQVGRPSLVALKVLDTP